MMFELAPHLTYTNIPIGYVVDLGGEEHLGRLDRDGNFMRIDSPNDIPEREWSRVEMFGPSLGLIVPCFAEILDPQAPEGRPIGHLTIAVIDGKPACCSISASLHGLSSSLLRQLPIARLVREAAMTNAVRVLLSDDGIFGARYVEGGPGFGSLHDDLRRELATVDEKARRRVIDDRFLSEVARLYREAMHDGRAPAGAVGDAFGPVTPATARRWIAMARREGYLGPAPARGKAGELAHVDSVS